MAETPRRIYRTRPASEPPAQAGKPDAGPDAAATRQIPHPPNTPVGRDAPVPPEPSGTTPSRETPHPTPPEPSGTAPSRETPPQPHAAPPAREPPHPAQKRGRGRKTQPAAPPTPAEVIRLKRRRCADAEDIAGFFVKLAAIAALLGVLFGFAFGLTPMQNDDMAPRISAGDLLFYYRLADGLVTGDVLVFEKNGEQYVGRIVANPGDAVEVTDQATLVVNGSTVLENDIYYTTPKYDDGPAYPLTLAQDEYFILCDYREGARDSRYFGPVRQAEIKGKVITVIRRSGL